MGPSGAHMAMRAGVGAVGGGLFGRYVTPNLLGYEDNPHATNMSTLLDASLAASIASGAPQIGAWARNPAMAAKILGTISAAELAPVAMNLMTKATDTTKQLSTAAESIKDMPLTAQIRNTAMTPEGKGALTGAGAAGVGAMLTGLLRARTQNESESDTGRGTMVTKDFLKLVLPAMLAGGLAGNMVKNRKPSLSS